MVICQTCGVEHSTPVEVCAICADERQWVPATGQHWATLETLTTAGHRVEVAELEPNLFGVTVAPKIGIGQQGLLVRTPDGNLLWDVVGYVDDHAVAQIRELGGISAIAASHPHMFGTQVEWSRAFGGVPVYVAAADMGWVARPDPVIRPWSGAFEVLPGVTMVQVGGHFPGSGVVHWSEGADGAGVLLASDSIQANPDRSSVTFMRSYPNRIPLSPGVVDRILRTIDAYAYGRLYDNLAKTIDGDAKTIVDQSGQRYIRWTRGDFDHLT
ncbi:MBL fold metallo-hydrolase [Spiractinospora alimapuensis]|uniref:hypothetical protein n=1 Tax=Spiractinospora alimapuensis TaxID=2820884 RepID=UPI001F43DC90|nr:hypothetical protein [Spiractinospora alimapuensis]QVQ53759.1 MBL fold metallo-hydrolase [Spiractinospora alimapuensis]